jgi:N-acetylmuramoyl-L-alanine amidase
MMSRRPRRWNNVVGELAIVTSAGSSSKKGTPRTRKTESRRAHSEPSPRAQFPPIRSRIVAGARLTRRGWVVVWSMAASLIVSIISLRAELRDADASARGGARANASGSIASAARTTEHLVPPGIAVASGACLRFPASGAPLRGTVFLDAGHGGIDPGSSGRTSSGAAVAESATTLGVVRAAIPGMGSSPRRAPIATCWPASHARTRLVPPSSSRCT